MVIGSSPPQWCPNTQERGAAVLETVKAMVLEINHTICQTVRFIETKRISNCAIAQLQK